MARLGSLARLVGPASLLFSVTLVEPSAAQSLAERRERRAIAVPAAAEFVESLAPRVSPIVRALASFEPGFLGVTTHESGERVFVSHVRAGSPAAIGGMRAGDEVVAVNGRRVKSVDEFAAAVEPFPPGAKLTFETRREGRRERVVAALGPARPGVDDGTRTVAATFLVERATLGARVGAVTEAARREYGTAAKRGALVAETVPGGPLAKAGIGVGAVIVAVDGRRVDSPQDLSQFVRNARIGQEVELTYYDGDQLRRKRVRLAAADGASEASDELETIAPPARGAPPETPDDPLEAPAPAPRGERAVERPAAPRGPVARPAPERGQALKRLEQVLDGLTRPAPAAPPVPAPPAEASAPPRDTTEAHLRLEVDSLRAEVAELKRRLAELERRVAPPPPPKPAPPADDDPNDDRPKLEGPRS